MNAERPHRRRRRRGATRPGASRAGEITAETIASAYDPEPDAPEPDVPDPESSAPTASGRRRRGDPAERGLRELIGGGPSQLGPVRAMRARDVNRPSDADLDAAEREVVLARRHWKPPTPR